MGYQSPISFTTTTSTDRTFASLGIDPAIYQFVGVTSTLTIVPSTFGPYNINLGLLRNYGRVGFISLLFDNFVVESFPINFVNKDLGVFQFDPTLNTDIKRANRVIVDLFVTGFTVQISINQVAINFDSGGGGGPGDWNTLLNKPAIFEDGQISWEEVINKPVLESGPFTPSLEKGSGSLVTPVPSSGTGLFTKIDNVLVFTLEISSTSAASGTNLPLRITGLPYPSSRVSPVSITYTALATFSSGHVLVAEASAVINLLFQSATGKNPFYSNQIRSGSQFYLAGSYLTT